VHCVNFFWHVQNCTVLLVIKNIKYVITLAKAVRRMSDTAGFKKPITTSLRGYWLLNWLVAAD